MQNNTVQHYNMFEDELCVTMMSDHDSSHQSEHESDVLTAKPAVKKPPLYAVVFHNDDYTPMNFVVYVLQDIFYHDEDSAVAIMLDIHHKGKGVAGVYAKEIAETKANVANTEARQQGYPLLCEIEPVEDSE